MLQPHTTNIAYATHRLRIGNYYIPYVRIFQKEDQQWQIEAFTQEVPRTIFISGTIYLRSPLFPEEVSIPKEISIEVGKELLFQTQDWQLYR